MAETGSDRFQLEVVLNVGREDAPEMSLADDDHVIGALAAERSDDAFTLLPRRSRRREHLLDAHFPVARGVRHVEGICHLKRAAERENRPHR
jgi:hypothetical protein